jgi:hypothetical protein
MSWALGQCGSCRIANVKGKHYLFGHGKICALLLTNRNCFLVDLDAEDGLDHGVGCDCSFSYTRPEMQSGLRILGTAEVIPLSYHFKKGVFSSVSSQEPLWVLLCPASSK